MPRGSVWWWRSHAAGRAFLPTQDSRLQTDDIVHVSATATGMVALHEQLGLGADGGLRC